MKGQHHYKLTVNWTGNRGSGTSGYRAYDRGHTISVQGKAEIPGSSDPAFLGDRTKHNPEEMLLAALSACHMLWYLHLCADSGVIVTDYVDNATGIMLETADGGGYFSEVALNPTITIAGDIQVEKLNALHKKANKFCYIANSVNFTVHHQATYKVSGT